MACVQRERESELSKVSQRRLVALYNITQATLILRLSLIINFYYFLRTVIKIEKCV